jgi:hypothetical protein
MQRFRYELRHSARSAVYKCRNPSNISLMRLLIALLWLAGAGGGIAIAEDILLPKPRPCSGANRNLSVKPPAFISIPQT